MMTIAAFQDLTGEVSRINGLPLEEAALFVGLVGDTPESDDYEMVDVRDASGKIVKRLQWPFEG